MVKKIIIIISYSLGRMLLLVKLAWIQRGSRNLDSEMFVRSSRSQNSGDSDD